MIVAVVPAAGQSARMGRPKPLLEVDGSTLIARVVAALAGGGASRVVVIVPPEGRAESAGTARAARSAGATVIVPAEQPADMRASIEIGIARIGSDAGPGPPPTGVLITPGDVPGIGADLVRRVVEAGLAAPGSIVVPRAGAKRGHPVFLPWEAALAIRLLPAGTGLNALIAGPGRDVVTVEVGDPKALLDIDTPDDYRRWTGRGPA